MHIVHIAAPAPVGGLERVVQALAAGQRTFGHAVTVIAVIGTQDNRHPFVEALRQRGVPVEEVRVAARSYLRELLSVRKLLLRLEPDVVHTHGYRSDLLGGSVARVLGIPRVSTVHGSSRLGGLSRIFEWAQLRAWRRFDAVIAVSSPLRTALEAAGVSAHVVHVIPNAWPGVEPTASKVDARSLLGLPAEGPIVGFVGRLIPAKGPDVFLEAFARLGVEDVSAVIVGDGAMRATLEARARQLGVVDRVRFVGHVDDATQLYTAFDVYVLSSRTEGTPIALLEAMAARVPIVASRVGGVPDVVAGLAELVGPEDVVAVAAAVTRVLEDREGAAIRAARARDVLDRTYGHSGWVSKHIAVYAGIRGAS